MGLGGHTFCMTLAQAQYTLFWALLAQVENIVGIGLIKISVCLCVLRVINRVSRLLRTFLWILIAFVSASHLNQAILILVECFPLAAVWDASIKGQCFPLSHVYLAVYIGFGVSPCI